MLVGTVPIPVQDNPQSKDEMQSRDERSSRVVERWGFLLEREKLR